MDTRINTTGWSWMVAVALVGGLASVAHAVDGVVLINQVAALAGNVTPGDAPGFPVTISQPGSYRLTSNLTVPNQNTTAIRVTADNVTLDLNGFAILASPLCITTPGTSCPSDGRGVDATDRDNVTVVNGTVRGMGDIGVLVGPNGRVEKVRAVGNGGDGIQAGDGSTLHGNTTRENRRSGIHAGAGSTVQGNTTQGDRDSGIVMANACTVQGNTAERNRAFGIVTANGCTVQGNTTNRNAEGISVGFGSTVQGNTAQDNDGFGLNLLDRVGYTDNVLSINGGGAVNGGTSLGQNLCDGVLC